jgi:rSAM/selenodomain-associated transferase 2
VTRASAAVPTLDEAATLPLRASVVVPTLDEAATLPLRASVVVPTLDEAAALPGLLDHLASLPGDWEVIVADGGSTDGTLALVREWAAGVAGARVVEAPRGRAAQQNSGAAAATGDVLVFLHADSRLPATAHASLAAALADPRVAGGNFALRFDGGDRFSRVLGAWYALQRRLGVWYGDSTIWVRPDVFDALGGFPPLPIMEDYALVRALRRAGATPCLPGPALTSGRRWRALGIPKTVASWVVIRWLFLAGVPAERLARLYRHVR